MAATDQPFRNQRRLDIVFGVSCLLMLAGVFWMFYDDQFRDWKKEQRQFRDVEEGMAQRAVVNMAPDSDQLAAIEAARRAKSSKAQKRGSANKRLAKKGSARKRAVMLSLTHLWQLSLIGRPPV